MVINYANIFRRRISITKLVGSCKNSKKVSKNRQKVLVEGGKTL